MEKASKQIRLENVHGDYKWRLRMRRWRDVRILRKGEWEGDKHRGNGMERARMISAWRHGGMGEEETGNPFHFPLQNCSVA